MKVLIADDDPIARQMLVSWLAPWGYEAEVVQDGSEAWKALQHPGGPMIAVLDWMMPGLSGPEVCRLVRGQAEGQQRYLLLLTARGGADSAAEGLDAGADDFVNKPFNHRELRARLAVGARVVRVELDRQLRIRDLEAALERVRVLQGLLPICAYCRRVRDGEDYWQQLEKYIDRHTDLQFSHGICPECLKTEFEGLHLGTNEPPGGAGDAGA